MKRLTLAAIAAVSAWLALAGSALAQSNPCFIPPGGSTCRSLLTNDVPTSTQWNSFFTAKQDALTNGSILAAWLAAGAAAGNLGFTPLSPANNLSDLGSASAARGNLGLGSAATQTSSAFLQPANNLSDLASASSARTALGLAALATTIPGAGVATALGLAANAAGGVVTSPVAAGALASGAAAANLGAPSGWLFGNGSSNPTGTTTIPGSNLTFVPPSSSLAETAQAAYARGINVQSYGALGSTSSTTVSSMTSGTNVATVANLRDFVVGQNVHIDTVGPSTTAAAPASVTATACGGPDTATDGVSHGCTLGSTSCAYYLETDDGKGGLSTPASVTVSNAQAYQSSKNNVWITFTPYTSDMPAAIWKSCAGDPLGRGEYFVGFSKSLISFTISAAGSGYANGSYQWVATGGGCTYEPAGFVTVSGGAITSGRIDPSQPGTGCTSPPTVNVSGISGIGSGTGGAIALALISEYDDNGTDMNALGTAGAVGSGASWVPSYIPWTHPASGQPDWLVGQIGAINTGSKTITLCQLDTAFTGCTPLNASNAPATTGFGSAGTSKPWAGHSWKEQLQNAINAAPTANAGNVVSEVKVPCGTYDYEAPLFMNSPSVHLVGELKSFRGCAQLTPQGWQDSLQVNWNWQGASNPNGPQAGNGVRNIQFNDQPHKSGGWDIDSFRNTNLFIDEVQFSYSPCAYREVQSNSAIIQHTYGLGNWGYNNKAGGYTSCSDRDHESTFNFANCCMMTQDNYWNDLGQTVTFGDGTRNGGFSRIGWEINGVATMDQLRGESGFSSVEGNAYVVENNSGQSRTNTGLTLQADAEFSLGDELVMTNCIGYCDWRGSFNGSVYGREVNIASPAEITWLGGRIQSAGQAGIYANGHNDTFTGVRIVANSLLSRGTYPAVEIGPNSLRTRIVDDVIGDEPSATDHAEPVLIDSGATGFVVTDNAFGTNNVLSHVVNNAGRSQGDVRCNQGDINDCYPTLGGSSLPFLLPPNGSVTDTAGDITLGTALDQTYPNMYIYLAANALGNSNAAGWFYATCSSTTACKVYNNVYSSGNPTIPASPTAFSNTVSASYTTTTGTYLASYSIIIPGYQVGPYDAVEVLGTLLWNNTANNKAASVYYGGVSFYTGTFTTNHVTGFDWGFRNVGTTNAQELITTTNGASGGFAPQSGAPALATIDTTTAQTLTVKLEMATATDYVMLLGATVKINPGVN